MRDTPETAHEQDIPDTIEKALAINLDPLKYGTIVEISAGQKVAPFRGDRDWRFRMSARRISVAR